MVVWTFFIKTRCNVHDREQHFKNCFRELQCLDFPRRASLFGGVVENLRFQEERRSMPRRSILSAAERENL
jgi:hypothetical protein